MRRKNTKKGNKRLYGKAINAPQKYRDRLA
jgi:hypothetical protein